MRQAIAHQPKAAARPRKTSIDKCRNAYLEQFVKARADGFSYAESRKLGATAYKITMPRMDSHESIREYIGCIAQGIQLEVFNARDGSQLLYAAQVAIGLNREKTHKDKRKPGKETQPVV